MCWDCNGLKYHFCVHFYWTSKLSTISQNIIIWHKFNPSIRILNTVRYVDYHFHEWWMTWGSSYGLKGKLGGKWKKAKSLKLERPCPPWTKNIWEILPFLKATKKEQNLWNWRGTPTKIDVHACYINTYLPKFFELILIN